MVTQRSGILFIQSLPASARHYVHQKTASRLPPVRQKEADSDRAMQVPVRVYRRRLSLFLGISSYLHASSGSPSKLVISALTCLDLSGRLRCPS